jgi:metal-responsive CopG/Arc/MetJ family transcriptional regulator
MTATHSTITLPEQLLREIDDAVAETGLSRDDLLHAAVHRFLRSDRRWRKLRQYGEERARALGIETEDDLEALMDSLPDEV